MADVWASLKQRSLLAELVVGRRVLAVGEDGRSVTIPGPVGRRPDAPLPVSWSPGCACNEGIRSMT